MSHSISVNFPGVLFIISNFYGLENERMVLIFKIRCHENRHIAIVTQNIPELLLTLELSSMSFPESCRGRPFGNDKSPSQEPNSDRPGVC